MDNVTAPSAFVRIVVVNYNAGLLLKHCLHSLLDQTYRNFEVVVVDNASQDGSLAHVPRDPRFRVIRNALNIGFAAANNQAVCDAQVPWIITLNPDTIAPPRWLETLMQAPLRYPGVSMFGSTQLCATSPHVVDGLGDVYYAAGFARRKGYRQRIPTPYPDEDCFSPCAAAALYRTEAYRACGGMEEKFFCYMEDVDLAFRLRLRGERCMQAGGAVVYHFGSALTGVKSPFSLYHGMRNTLWTWGRNMPYTLMLPLLPLHLLALGAYVLASGSASGMRASLRGLRDGLRSWRDVRRDHASIHHTRRVSVWQVAKMLDWRVWKLAPALRRKNRHSQPARLSLYDLTDIENDLMPLYVFQQAR